MIAMLTNLVDLIFLIESDRNILYLLAASLQVAQGNAEAATNLAAQGKWQAQRPSPFAAAVSRILEQTQQVERAEQLYQRILSSDPTFAPGARCFGELWPNAVVTKDQPVTIIKEPWNMIATILLP